LTGWPLVPLGRYLRIKHGFAFQGEYFSDQGHYIVLTPGNFIESGGFKPKSGAEKYYTAPPPPEYVLRRGDLVIAMTEQAQGLLGSSAVIPVDETYLHNQRIGLVEQHSGATDRRFLYYLFNTRGVRDQIQATATGSKVRHTAPARVESVTVHLPPLPAQRKIAAILSAFDDLIENHHRRIKILDEIARRIYQEWFVDFRYPGHEGIPLVKTELGSMPERWSVRSLSSITETITRGVSPRYAESSKQLVINQRCIRDGRLDLAVARRHSTRVPPAKMLRVGDVLINSTGIGTLGRVAQVLFPLEEVTVDSHVTIVRPASKAALSDFFGLALLERESDFAAMGVGSTGQTELGRSAIGALKVALPPMHIQNVFASVITGLRQLSVGLAVAKVHLRATRDLLLPRLMSGQIDISDLDITLPEEPEELEVEPASLHPPVAANVAAVLG
jgi:type I restriction enzyme S subunit